MRGNNVYGVNLIFGFSLSVASRPEILEQVGLNHNEVKKKQKVQSWITSSSTI